MNTTPCPLRAHGTPVHSHTGPIAERPRRRLPAAAIGVAGITLAAVLAACSGASGSASIAVPSIAIPSVNVSAAASAGAQIALSALDRVDAAIATNQTSGALSADNATSLKTLSGSVRTALQNGDMTAAKSAFDQLSTKATGVSAGLSGDSKKALDDAIAALKAAMGS